MKFTIRILNEQDWKAYRSIRLDSLQDSPDSFGSTFERERQFTEDQWRSRLDHSSDEPGSAIWAASVESTLIGLISAVVQRDNPDCANLYQMWVAPRHRGSGVGSALIQQVQVWGADLDVNSFELSVTISNTDAVLMYKKMGFVQTGHTEPLRTGSELLSQSMLLKL